MRGYPTSSIKFLRGLKDLTRPDVRTLAHAAQGVANHHIRHTMQRKGDRLPGDMRIVGGLENPTGGKFDGRQSHRWVLAPEGARPSFDYGADGLFYANAFGAFGGVSSGKHWGRLSGAVHRRG